MGQEDRNTICLLATEPLHQNAETQDNSMPWKLFSGILKKNVYCIIFNAMPWDFEPWLVWLADTDIFSYSYIWQPTAH